MLSFSDIIGALYKTLKFWRKILIF